MRRYVVIGGGVSGLAAARWLAGATPVAAVAAGSGCDTDTCDAVDGDTGGGCGGDTGGGCDVVLLEASDRLGGKILTGSFGAGSVELGPDQFLRRDPSAERLCRLLGLGDDLVAPGAGTAAVYAAGRPRQLPAGLALGIPTDLDALAASGIVSDRAVEYARNDAERPGRALEADDVGLVTGQARPGGGGPDDGSAWLAAVSRERSAGAVLRPRLGDEIVDRLVDPLIGGINAGSIDNLSLGTVAPQIARALVGHHDVVAPLAGVVAAPVAAKPTAAAGAEPVPDRQSPFFGLVGGLGRLVSGIEEELRQLGCEVRLACPALGIRRADTGSSYVVDTPDGEIAADGIVVAVPAGHAAALLAGLAPEAAVQLSTIAYGSVVVVTFAVDGPLPALLDGWTGVLVPRIEGRLTTAVTLLSVKWPWTSTDYPDQRLVRVSAGRNGDTRIAALNDADLGRNLAQELAELTGITVPPERPRPTAEARAPATATSVSPLAHPLPPEGRPTTCHVQRWDESFPQYAPGHAARIGIVQRALAQQGGIALAGAALGGIGIPACITSGERAAALVSAAVAASA